MTYLLEARDGGVNAIHVTISYWENTESTLANIGDWRRRFRENSDLIMPVRTGDDIRKAEAFKQSWDYIRVSKLFSYRG